MTFQHPYRDPITNGDPIPAPETAMLPFGNTEELRQRWRALMGDLGFSESLLWLGLVMEDRLVPPLPQFEIPDHVPIADVADLYVQRIGMLAEDEPDMMFTFLLTRPGRGGASPQDRMWARVLTEAARRHDVPLLAVHRANDDELITLADPTDGIAAA